MKKAPGGGCCKSRKAIWLTALRCGVSKRLGSPYRSGRKPLAFTGASAELPGMSQRFSWGPFSSRRREMDWNRIEGNWKQVQGRIKEKWGKLTDDDLTKINGQREQLEGIIQQRYGLEKDMVRKDIDAWLNSQP
jgi:uncharacterized protein YjbJ (UPF0337 family)